MSPEKQRIKIAEACPTVFDTKDGYMRYRFDHQKAGMAVDPLTDLNAMHEAEKMLTTDQREEYAIQLVSPNQTNSSRWDCAHANAAQRAEAFLKTIGKWEEE